MERLRTFFIKPENVFLVFGLVFGILFMLVTPPFQVPDEPAHLHRAMEVANGEFYIKNTPDYSKYDRILAKNLMYKGIMRNLTQSMHTVSGYAPVMYITSALGIKLGAAFQNPDLMFYLARLFNLFSWLALIYFAIKITPVFKWHFVLFILLPMSVYEGMSVSADSFVNGYLFLFSAYMFKLIFDEKERLSKKDIAIYFIMTLLSAFLKGCLIYPAFLIVFIKDKRKWLIGMLIIAVSVLSGGLWAANNHVAIGWEGDPDAAKAFIINKPFLYIILLFKTLFRSSIYWLKGAIGILGWLQIKFKPWFYQITSLVYFSSLMTIPAEKPVKKSMRVVAFGLIFLYMIIMLTALYCTWTPVVTPRIIGFQGRYLICMFPLFFLLLGNNKKLINEQKYLKYYLVYVFIILSYACYILHGVYQFS